MVIPYQRPDGTMGMIPKSISFDEMSQEEFEPLLNLLIRQCSKYLGIDEREMAKNYIAYL
jgi:hypothetical protein